MLICTLPCQTGITESSTDPPTERVDNSLTGRNFLGDGAGTGKNLRGRGGDGNGACGEGAGLGMKLRERDWDEILSPCKTLLYCIACELSDTVDL